MQVQAASSGEGEANQSTANGTAQVTLLRNTKGVFNVSFKHHASTGAVCVGHVRNSNVTDDRESLREGDEVRDEDLPLEWVRGFKGG